MNALVAFEAAARHESFTRAAKELCVTQGAVSHQVKALEAELGLKLFQRLAQGLELTRAGRDYFMVARDALDRVASGTDQLLKRQGSGILTVSVSPNFAAKCIIHRLGKFTRAFPEIDLRLSAAMRHVDFAAEDVDLAVRHGDGGDASLHMTKLFSEELFPVCSPRLMEGPHSLRDPGNLIHHDLLHLDRRDDWTRWLDAACVGPIDIERGPVFNQASMVIDAAVAGQGVGLARSGLAARDLIQGHLVRPFKQSLSAYYAYWIVCPQSTAELPKIKQFRDWLVAEAQEDMRRLAELAAAR